MSEEIKWLGLEYLQRYDDGAPWAVGAAINRTAGWAFWGNTKGEVRQFRVAEPDEKLAQSLLSRNYPDLELTSRHSLGEPLVKLLGLEPGQIVQWLISDEEHLTDLPDRSSGLGPAISGASALSRSLAGTA